MNTDGFVKVDGEELIERLKSNLALLKYNAVFEEASRINRKMDSEKKFKEKEKLENEKALRDEFYLLAHAKVDIERMKKECTIWVPIVFQQTYWFFFTRYVKNGAFEFKKEEFKKKLIEANPEFWTNVTFDSLEDKNYNYHDFCEYYISARIRTFFDRPYHYILNRGMSHDEIILNKIKQFLNLKGEVFLSIKNYNFVNSFIESYHLDAKKVLMYL